MSFVGSVRGRGRGRGRGLYKPQVSDTSVAEDVVDGCSVRNTFSMQELMKCFSDEEANNDSSVVMASHSLINGTNVRKCQVSADTTPPQQRSEQVDVPIVVVAVKYNMKYAEVKFDNKELNTNCKVRLYESETMKKWKAENPLVFKAGTMEETALLSSLEMNIGEQLTARKVLRDPDEEYTVVSIDVFVNEKLRQDFMSSLIYCSVPRLPAVDCTKIAVITNLRGENEIDVVFYEQVWIGLRETLHAVQMERKLFHPKCLVIQQLYKEMIDGFNAHSFLAPLNDDWSEMHRVRILGREDDYVKVLYIDIGKQRRIHLNDLSIPTLAKCVPDMIDKVPPQAVTIRVGKMNANNFEIVKSLQTVLEGRVCYVKTVDDSKIPPIADVYITNSQGVGTVSLADLTTSISTRTPLKENVILKPDHLNSIKKRLDELVTDWKASFVKENASSKGLVHCNCCKDKMLGVYKDRAIPSVSRSLYSENLCA